MAFLFSMSHFLKCLGRLWRSSGFKKDFESSSTVGAEAKDEKATAIS